LHSRKEVTHAVTTPSSTPPQTQTPAEIVQSVQLATGAQNRTELQISDGMDDGETRDPV
jgi:hypothetical protein